MCADACGHEDAHDILSDQEDYRNDTENHERPPTGLQSREFCGQSDRREENEQEEVREPGGKLNRSVAELMEQRRHDGDQYATHHGHRYIEAPEQRNAARDCGRNHEREQSDGKRLEIVQRNRFHLSPFCRHDGY